MTDDGKVNKRGLGWVRFYFKKLMNDFSHSMSSPARLTPTKCTIKEDDSGANLCSTNLYF